MNLSELAAAEAPALAVAASMGGDSLFEIGVKRFCTGRILAEHGPGDRVAIEDAISIADDFETPFPDDRVVELLLATGVFERDGEDALRVREAVALNDFYPSFLRARRLEVPLADFHRALTGDGAAPAGTGGATVRASACADAIERSWGFASEVIGHVLDRELAGVPVFWRCEGGPHLPLLNLPGTATTMDTALLFGTAIEFGRTPSLDGERLDQLGRFVSEVLLGLQRREAGWDHGAFVYDGPDEDFVGIFLDEFAERGAPPTVDGTADALLSLSVLSRWPGSPDFLGDAVPTAAADAAGFLLRQQLEEGAWPVYRYERDEFEMPARMFSSSLAASGLVAAWRASLLPGSLGEEVRAALGRYAGWLARTAWRDGAELGWDPAGDADFEAQQLFTTLWAARSLLSLARAPGLEIGAPLDEMLTGALAFIDRRWRPDPEAFAVVPFRVPTWEGPARGQFSWELPADPLIASLILRVATMREEEAGEDAWQRISAVVAASLESEEHGHWVDFLMKKEGDNRAVPGNTRYNQELLLSFLDHMKMELTGGGLS